MRLLNKFPITSGAILGVLAGTFLGIAIMINVNRLEEVETTCEKLAVSMPTEYGYVYIGAIELCGENLTWGNIKGPLPPRDETGGWQ